MKTVPHYIILYFVHSAFFIFPLDKAVSFVVIMYEMDSYCRRFHKQGLSLLRPAVLFAVVFFCVICSIFFFGLGDSGAALAKADKVLVIKSKRLMILLKDGEIFRTYKVALGKQSKGHKTMQGDRKTPEGRYVLDTRNPRSKYHLAMHISYPNESDILNAQKRGVSPGGDIMIHGLPRGSGTVGELHSFLDWTDGCIAVTDNEMEEIWQLVSDGTPIEIKP